MPACAHGIPIIIAIYIVVTYEYAAGGDYQSRSIEKSLYIVMELDWSANNYTMWADIWLLFSWTHVGVTDDDVQVIFLERSFVWDFLTVFEEAQIRVVGAEFSVKKDSQDGKRWGKIGFFSIKCEKVVECKVEEIEFLG